MHAVLETVACRIERVVEGMDITSAQRTPGGMAHRWSSQQIVEHLVLSCRATRDELEARLQKGRVTRHQKRTKVQWTLQMMILTFGYFPAGTPAFDETLPMAGRFPPMQGRQLANLLREEFNAMDTVFDSCRRKFGMERVAVHPLLGPLRVDQWRRFHVVHGTLHLEQLQHLNPRSAPQLIPCKVATTSLAKELHIPAQRPFA